MTDKSSKKESAPIWLSTLEASIVNNQSKPESKYLQLATVNEGNLAEVRTLVFRGFLESSTTMLMHTDIRSSKVDQIKAQNNAQICWYFSESREQYRLTGQIQNVDFNDNKNQSLRLQHWQALSGAAKQSYFWDTPGETLGLNDQHQVSVCDSTNADKVSDNFSILLFSVLAVDHLQLMPSPHVRRRYHYNNHHWHSDVVNP